MASSTFKDQFLLRPLKRKFGVRTAFMSATLLCFLYVEQFAACPAPCLHGF